MSIIKAETRPLIARLHQKLTVINFQFGTDTILLKSLSVDLYALLSAIRSSCFVGSYIITVALHCKSSLNPTEQTTHLIDNKLQNLFPWRQFLFPLIGFNKNIEWQSVSHLAWNFAQLFSLPCQCHLLLIVINFKSRNWRYKPLWVEACDDTIGVSVIWHLP